MRYCTSCRRFTEGQPLFCSGCGNSFDVRLCPRLHANPRSARVCSQCGSRELSTPQAVGPLLVRLSNHFLSLLPGMALLLLSIALFVAFLETVLTNQDVQGQLIVILLLLGVAWWAYSKLPAPIRHGVSRLIRRRRGNGHH
jgi:hypothetical protein